MELSLQKRLGKASGLVATGKCRLGDNELEVTLLLSPGGSRAGKHALLRWGTCEKVRVTRDASSDGQERVGGVGCLLFLSNKTGLFVKRKKT